MSRLQGFYPSDPRWGPEQQMRPYYYGEPPTVSDQIKQIEADEEAIKAYKKRLMTDEKGKDAQKDKLGPVTRAFILTAATPPVVLIYGVILVYLIKGFAGAVGIK